MSYNLPIINLNSDEQLNLSFDHLADEAIEFSYTFVKCDANWKKSENVFFHDFSQGLEDQLVVDYL